MTTNYYAPGTTEVTTTATLIGIFPTEGGDPQAIVPDGTHICIKNNGPQVVFLGDSEVVADATNVAGGYMLAPGETVNLPAPGGSTQFDLYAITSVGSAYVTYIFLGAIY